MVRHCMKHVCDDTTIMHYADTKKIWFLVVRWKLRKCEIFILLFPLQDSSALSWILALRQSPRTQEWGLSLYQNARWKVTRIAKELKIKVNTVKGIVAKYEETGSVKNRPGQGRKRLLTSKEVARKRNQRNLRQRYLENLHDLARNSRQI